MVNGKKVDIPEHVFAFTLADYNRFVNSLSPTAADREAIKKLRRQYQGRISSRTARDKRRRQNAALRGALVDSHKRVLDNAIDVFHRSVQECLTGCISSEQLHAFVSRTTSALLACGKSAMQ